MSLTPAVAESLRQALGVKYGIRDASAFATVARDAGTPAGRLLPDPVKQEIRAMLTSWGLA
jgi:hypothetical protein